jgi:antitoxin component YwqK of YwqJK toxin-antitoxin module
MTSGTDALNIVEVPHEDGSLGFRYSRYRSRDHKRWIRHGPFQAFHPNGQLASEGAYEDGFENGPWKDYHANGRPSAEGGYRAGKKHGLWRYWDEDGRPEPNEEYVDGILESVPESE